MKHQRTSKCAKTFGKLMLIVILVGLVNRLTKTQKEKAVRKAKREGQHKEWASGKMLFSDEDSNL